MSPYVSNRVLVMAYSAACHKCHQWLSCHTLSMLTLPGQGGYRPEHNHVQVSMSNTADIWSARPWEGSLLRMCLHTYCKAGVLCRMAVVKRGTEAWGKLHTQGIWIVCHIWLCHMQTMAWGSVLYSNTLFWTRSPNILTSGHKKQSWGCAWVGCDDYINVLMVPNGLAGSGLRINCCVNTSRRVMHAMSTIANTIFNNALGTQHLHGVVSPLWTLHVTMGITVIPCHSFAATAWHACWPDKGLMTTW